MIYIAQLDLSLVVADLSKKYDLGSLNRRFPFVTIKADDPDDACFMAIKKLMDTILDQDDSIETKKKLKELKYDIRVLKLESHEKKL